MSLGTLLKHIGDAIASIFRTTVKDLETVILPAAIAATNALKTVTDADTTDILGHIAGSAGATIEDKLRSALTNIVPRLQLAQQFLSSSADSATILAQVIKVVGNAPSITKTAFYVEFSGLVATDLADGKLTLAESVQLAQYFYTNYPQPTKDTVVAQPQS